MMSYIIIRDKSKLNKCQICYQYLRLVLFVVFFFDSLLDEGPEWVPVRLDFTFRLNDFLAFDPCSLLPWLSF